ncbi:MAG: lamin tail domain-containing protein [bacterium]
MHAISRMRTALSTATALLLALPMVSLGLPAAAHASASSLVINEVNWAGSSVSANDQWVELYNPGPAVDFSLHPYTISVDGTDLVTLTSGAVLSHGEYIVSRLGAAQSTQLLVIGKVDSALVLPHVDLQLQLKDENGDVVDTAGDGTGSPLAGSDGMTGVKVVSSMSRVAGTTDGTKASSWYTPATVGKYIDNGVIQYGTPGTDNLEVAAPGQLALDPHPAANQPTITGTIIPAVGQAMPGLVQVRFTRVSDGTVTGVNGFVNATTGNFSVIYPGVMGPALYRITVTSLDITPNAGRSATVEVPIAGSPQNLYLVNPASVTVSVPTLDAYPTLTNQTTVTLTGTVDAGTALVISVNGTEYGTTPIAAGQTTFSRTVTLLTDQVNQIEVRAQDSAFNVSAPAIATITQDSMAPKAVVAGLVKVSTNAPGTQDSVQGMAGAAEANAFVDVYADASLTTKIATGSVAANGSFGPILVGDNTNTTLYLVVRDAAGNVSPATLFENPVAFATQTITMSITVGSITGTQATVSWTPISGAAAYRIKYKPEGGSFSSPMTVCAGVATCQSTTINGLSPLTSYVVAVAAVDAAGNESNYTEKTFVTGPPANVGGGSGPLPGLTVATKSSGTSVKTPVTVVTPSPAPTVSPTEQGEVKSENTTSSTNWTPWIILAILIALAVLATAGYFYWFGGEDEDADEAGTTGSGKNEPTPATDQKNTAKKADKEKRW